MENESKLFKAYYILIILYAIFGLSDVLLSSGTRETYEQIPILWGVLGGIFTFAIFILSIIALVSFIKNKFAKITLILPIAELILIPVVFLYGVVLGVISLAQGTQPIEQLITPGVIIFGIISSSLELLFSIYLLYRFRRK